MKLMNAVAIGYKQTTVSPKQMVSHIGQCQSIALYPVFTVAQGDPFVHRLGWVDLDFEFPVVNPNISGLKGISKKRQSCNDRW